MFGTSAATAVRYAQLLTTAGVERGLLGPREAARVWSRHLFNCGAIAPALPRGARVADIGSGAGLPGVVLAIARPDVHMVLIEPMKRRAEFLDEVVELLDLPRVEVRRARAEELAADLAADVVTARAVAPLRRLIPLAMRLLRPHGALLALKGAAAAEELAAAENTLQDHGAASAVIEHWGGTMLAEPTTVVRVVAGGDPGRRARRSPGSGRQGRRSEAGPAAPAREEEAP